MIIQDDTLTLKILTVNTHKGFTAFNRRFILHELRDAIRATSADVVFLQEVLGAHQHWARGVALWPTSSQYEFLADTIWKDFAYGRNAVYPHGHHGNALLSKFPITRHENLDISEGNREKRGLLHCVLRPPGLNGDIHAICVHLGLREKQRRKQLASLFRLIDERVPPSSPLLIAGDFNDWRLGGQNIVMRSGILKEVFRETRGRVARTFPSRFPLLCLDRIYVRNVVWFEPVILAASPWAHLSDHAPLAARVAL